MEFRLTYQGPLSANGSPKEKQEIRRKLRQQLAELWKQLPLRAGPKTCNAYRA